MIFFFGIVSAVTGLTFLGLSFWLVFFPPASVDTATTSPPVPGKRPEPVRPAPPKSVPPQKSPLENRARGAVAWDQPDEAKLASTEWYRKSKLQEFATIVDVAKAVCQSAGHRQVLSDLDTILLGGTLLIAAWPSLRPALEKNPGAMFACQIMLVSCWTTPQSALRHFGLHERNGNDSDRDVLNLITVTASSLKQMLTQMGIPLK
jgi:hypothetical protein